jgi:hypothetical protein
MRRIRLACGAVLTGALTACGAPEVKNTYEGPERAASEVAVLFTPRRDAYTDKRPRALFSAVDGRRYGTDMAGYPAAARVAPGEVLVKVNCTVDDPHPRWDSFLLFHATLKAGHYYELACDRVTASAIDRGASYDSIRHLLPEALQAGLAQ